MIELQNKITGEIFILPTPNDEPVNIDILFDNEFNINDDILYLWYMLKHYKTGKYFKLLINLIDLREELKSKV